MKVLMFMPIWAFIFYLSEGWTYFETRSVEDQADIPVIVESSRDVFIHVQSQESKELERFLGSVQSDFVENCLVLQIHSSGFKICGKNLHKFISVLEKETSSQILASLSWEPIEGYIYTSKERNFRIDKRVFNGVGYLVMQFPVFRSGYIEYKPSDLHLDDSARKIILNHIHPEYDREIKIAGITTIFGRGR